MGSLLAIGLAQANSLTFATGVGSGLLGFGLIAAAGMLDSRILIPGILGSTKAKPPRLLEVPQMTVSPGAPRIFAIGRRVRMPVHVMFQSDKVRNQSVSATKGGVPNLIKAVTADVGLALNGRKSTKLVMLTGNGSLLYWESKNLVSIRSDQMVASVASGRLRLAMASLEEPDFADRFAVHDRVVLAGWLSNGGPNVNVGYWKVHSVTPHAGSTPSRIDLDIYGGQTLAGLAATAGTVATPASIARVDDALVEHAWGIGNPSTALDAILLVRNPLIGPTPTVRPPDEVFSVGDQVTLVGFTTNMPGGTRLVVSSIGENFIRLTTPGASILALGYTITNAGTSTDAGRVVFWNPTPYPPNLFAADPALTFHAGTEDQVEDPIIAQTEATGEIPGFRGVCYQTLDGFELSQFGNQLPLMESILDVDIAMTWGEAITLLCGRCGLLASEVDISDVDTRPFEGYYVRGPIPGVQTLQPICAAGQIVAQERGEQLAFFNIENADIVQLENGEEFSDLGAYVGRDTPLQVDKLQRGQLDNADLPTSIGIRHQDPDNVYADGFQHFGLRQPTPTGHENQQELDLSQLVLTRKQARNLAGTVMRRTWINANTVEMVLPCAYLDLCENDLVTVTDDEGQDILARIIRRDIGTNYLVAVTAVREHINLAVSGSPVQGSSNTVPPVVNAPVLATRALDIAPLTNAEMFVPGLLLAACSEPGGHWAGCSVWESTDNGTNYSRVETIETETCIGITTTNLAAVDTPAETLTGGPFWDETSTVDVSLSADGLFPIASTSKSEVVAGHNWALIGDEIVGFQNVTLQDSGDFRLSGLLRGLRGTYRSVASVKLAKQQFTLLTFFQASGKFRTLIGLPAGSTVLYKFVPSGASLADVPAVTVTVQFWNARPFPVRDVTKVIDGGTFLATFKMAHWTRSQQAVGFLGPYPLDESYEGYTLRIYDPSGGVVRRIKRKSSRGPTTAPNGSPTIRDRWFEYSAAEQTADGYTPGPSCQFWIDLAQDGDVGEGRTNKQLL